MNEAFDRISVTSIGNIGIGTGADLQSILPLPTFSALLGDNLKLRSPMTSPLLVASYEETLLKKSCFIQYKMAYNMKTVSSFLK